jgi:tetratricopeptide (TPR) repeat protein
MRHQLVIPEQNNIRVALEWALAAGEIDTGLRLALALENFWMTSDPLEGRRWVEALLASSSEVDPWLHAFAFRTLGNALAITGDREHAIELYEQSLADFRECGDELRIAIGQHRLATNLTLAGQTDRGRTLNEEALEYFRRVGFRKGEAQCYSVLAHLERRAGHPERAVELYEGSVALSRETGFSWWELHMLLLRAEVLYELGRPDEAARSASEGLGVARRIADRLGTVEALAFLSRAAIEREDEELAGRLWGAIEADVARAPLPYWENEQDEFGKPILARAGRPFEDARAEGQTLSLDEAAELALGAAPGADALGGGHRGGGEE